MVEILNNNQGVLSLLSLIITIVGFFIVNKNIKVSNKQTQRNGNNGVNQQAQSRGINQSARRDLTNN